MEGVTPFSLEPKAAASRSLETENQNWIAQATADPTLSMVIRGPVQTSSPFHCDPAPVPASYARDVGTTPEASCVY